MGTHLFLTIDGAEHDFGPASVPHDSISGVRRIFRAAPGAERVQWRDGDGFVAFEGRRVSVASFGWRSPTMATLAFAAVAP